MDAISEARLKEVHPLLAEKIRQLAQMLAQEQITLIVTAGLRSWATQQALYEKGRVQQSDGFWIVNNRAAIVTNAPGGYSQHNFGLAVDVAPESISGVIDWNASHPQWQRIADVGTSLGLDSGAHWQAIKDYPHLQLTGKWPVTPNDEQRQTLRDGGMVAVWDESGLTDSPPQSETH